MRPHANRAPALAIERNYRFGTEPPAATYANPGFIVAAVFSPARGIECEFDERDELMQTLIFGVVCRACSGR